MIKIREKDKNILKKIIPDVEKYIKNDVLDELLDELDSEYAVEVVTNGIDDEPTDYAYDIERVRDHLYDDNIEEYRRTH